MVGLSEGVARAFEWAWIGHGVGGVGGEGLAHMAPLGQSYPAPQAPRGPEMLPWELPQGHHCTGAPAYRTCQQAEEENILYRCRRRMFIRLEVWIAA